MVIQAVLETLILNKFKTFTGNIILKILFETPKYMGKIYLIFAFMFHKTKFNFYFRLLRSYLLKLRQEDGYEAYRERETTELSRIVQKRIHDLQNPPDCGSAKKVVCSINKGKCC